MAWTYSGDPQLSNRDAVRFLIGDTDPNDKLVQDEEIDFAISEEPSNLYWAAADVLNVLANKFARDVSISADGISVSGGERARQFAERATALRQQGSSKNRFGLPYIGGIGDNDPSADEDGVDELHWQTGMHDAPGTNQQITYTEELF